MDLHSRIPRWNRTRDITLARMREHGKRIVQERWASLYGSARGKSREFMEEQANSHQFDGPEIDVVCDVGSQSIAGIGGISIMTELEFHFLTTISPEKNHETMSKIVSSSRLG